MKSLLLKLSIVALVLCTLSIYAQNEQIGNPYSNEPIPAPSESVEKKKKNKQERAKKGDKAKVQVAILLDTSNSMDGLIDQAKSQLWKMVNELALARDSKGNIPDFELALYEYGNDNLSQKDGYIRIVAELTTDLDLISEKLFSLTTRGGNEYCGHVIQTSNRELKWTKDNDDLKIIFIAGNEPFTQGSVPYETSCKNAIADGIIINTIYCGDYQDGIETKWKHGADLADGKYMNIDQNEAVVHIDAPQDDKIIELNKKLNDTYIGYGSAGISRKMMQATQDVNAAKYGKSNAAQRAYSKSTSNYKNSSWDLVDALEEEKIDVAKLKKEDLPEEMKDMNEKERKEYIEKKSEERKAIQKEIAQLKIERDKYVAKERKKMAEDSDVKTLDDVINVTIREQAKTKNFKFEKQ